MRKPLHLLQEYWNHTAFRPPQEEIIATVLAGRDTLALLPTGGGKSVCFQIPALAQEGICIVISPLVALIKDQTASLQKKGIKAAALTGHIPGTELDSILDNCIYGGYTFLYLSPERLQQELVQQRIKQMPVTLIAIDEAHCISQWGNDFRPAYRNCSLLRDFFPAVPIMALTASATGRVIGDMIENLNLRDPAVIRKSFARKNIAYMVFEEADKLYKTSHILKKNPGTAIVYVRNRKATQEVSAYLNKEGISAGFYHGGISSEEKTTYLQQWLKGETRVMVATNAFGMGIDKPDVRTVIHIHLPENIENYYQEAGRAGRDGQKAFAVILKNKNDKIRVKRQFLDVFPDVAFMKLLYKKLNTYFQIPYGEGEDATFQFNFNDFCLTYHLPSLRAYQGIKLLDRNSIISLSETFESKTSLQFIVSSTPLFLYLDKHPKIKPVAQALLRTYGGIFDYETRVNLSLISAKTATPEAEVKKVLERLYADGMITYKAHHTDIELSFLVPREDDRTIHRIASYIKQQQHLKKRQIEAVIDYIGNDEVCKSSQLLAYFEEEQQKPCGICSVCIEKKRRLSGAEKYRIGEAVLSKISNTPLSSRALATTLPYKEQDIIEALQLLLEHKKISIMPDNTYTLTK